MFVDEAQSEDMTEAQAAHEAAAAAAREVHSANAALGGKVCTKLLTPSAPVLFSTGDEVASAYWVSTAAPC